jgi:hypothetical protein
MRFMRFGSGVLTIFLLWVAGTADADPWPSPRVEVVPSSCTVVLSPGESTTRTLTIRNTGDTGLSFTIAAHESLRSLYPQPMLASARTEAPRVLTANGNSLVLEYTFAQPSAAKRGEYDLLSIAGLENVGAPGAPLLPAKAARILLPNGKKVTTLRVLPLDTVALPGAYRLAPRAAPVSLDASSTPHPTTPDPAIYASSASWPGKDFESLGVQSKRGYRVLTLNLFPVQWVPATRSATFSPRMRVEVSLVAATSGDSLSVVRSTPETREVLAAQVDNVSALDTYPASSLLSVAAASLTSSSLPSPGPYEYVVITSSTLAAASGPWNFQALCERKQVRGVSATIVTTDYIYEHYSGARPDGKTDNPTRIRNFLADAYQHWGTRFALLGGANTVVPSRLFQVRTYAGGDITTMPVDLYYGCVEPVACSFDGDHDGIYGEATDGPDGGDVDLLAEIYVGRAPVENAAEVASFVRKTLQYEASDDDYLSTVTMLGEQLGFGGVSDFAQGMMEQIRLGGSYNGYFTRGFGNHEMASFRRFRTSRNLYDTAENWLIAPWTPEDLVHLFDTGTHIFNHMGHATATSSMKLTTADLPGLTNANPFFVYSQGCDSGSFDSSDCFAEVLTTVEGGAFAAIMNARLGWGVENSTDGPSQRFNRQFWHTVLGDGVLEMGRANQLSKEGGVAFINEPCIRWCYYGLTLFGDPETAFRFQLDAPWLGVRPKTGTLAPGGETTVAVGVVTAGMGLGKYDANVDVRTNDKVSRSVAVPVALYVRDDDLFVLPGETLTFVGPEGAPFEFAPTSQTLTVTNVGATALPWSARTDAEWLDLVPDGAAAEAGASIPVHAALNANAEALTSGTYTASITFTNELNGTTLGRTVRITVLERDAAASFVWSEIASPQAIKGPFPVTLTARDARGYTATGFSERMGLTAAQWVQFQGNEWPAVLISEIDPSLQDCVEFTNVTGAAVDVSGWQVSLYDWDAWPDPQVTFTIPAGTVCAAGGVFLLYDEGTAPGTYPAFYTGKNVFWNNSPYGNAIAVLLRDAEGNVRDFVCANNAEPYEITQPIPIPSSEWWDAAITGATTLDKSMQRIGNTDRNDRYDWDVFAKTLGTTHLYMELPYQALPAALYATPKEIAFERGAWSGLVTVREGMRKTRLRARTADKTEETFSGIFDVTFYAGFADVILNHLLGVAPLSDIEQHRLDVNDDGSLDVADLTFLRDYEAALPYSETKSKSDDAPVLSDIRTTRPDLVVTSLGWANGDCTDAQTPEISFRAVNAGPVASASCGYEVFADKTSAAAGALPPLVAGAGEIRFDHVALPALRPGRHAIQVSLDPTNAIAEVKEGNNIRVQTLPVRIGPRTLAVDARRVAAHVRPILVPITLTRAGNAAGVSLEIETDPAAFTVSDVSVPQGSPLAPELHWHSLGGGITRVVVFFTPNAAVAEETLPIAVLRLDAASPHTPASTTVHLRAGAVGDTIGNASRPLTVQDARIPFGTGIADWNLYDGKDETAHGRDTEAQRGNRRDASTREARK